jgi:hypothetical protein
VDAAKESVIVDVETDEREREEGTDGAVTSPVARVLVLTVVDVAEVLPAASSAATLKE